MAMSDGPELLRRLFARLHEASIGYCVLRNWETLPEAVGNDVDLWVDETQGRAFEELLGSLARELGWRLVQRWHWLGYHGDGLFVFAKPETRGCLIVDAFKCLTWKGLRYVDESAFRRHAHAHPKGFLILQPGVEAASILVKEILFEGELRERYRARVARMARADGERFTDALSPVVGEKMAGRVLDHAVAEQWTRLEACRRPLAIELAARSLARHPLATVLRCAGYFYFRARERIRPTGGFLLVLIGPDGAGKTTTARAVLDTQLVRQLFKSTSYLYRRFPLLPELKTFLPSPLRRRLTPTPEAEAEAEASGDGTPPAGMARSVLYVTYYGLEYFLGRVWLWKHCTLGNGIVVFDRYWHEFILQTRYRRCPRFLLRLLARLAAQPDALVFLDVDPEVAYDRKREQPLAEIQRLHRLCGEIVAESRHGYSFEARGVEQSVERLEQIILERLVERTPSSLSARPR